MLMKQSNVCATHKHSWLDPLGLQASSHPTMFRNLQRSECRSSWSDLCLPRTQRSRRWSACFQWSGPVLSQRQNLCCGWPDRQVWKRVAWDVCEGEGRGKKKLHISVCLVEAAVACCNTSFSMTHHHLQLGLWLNGHNNPSFTSHYLFAASACDWHIRYENHPLDRFSYRINNLHVWSNAHLYE